MKTCNHEKVCARCIESEIAELQKKIDILKNKLPNNINIYPNLPSWDKNFNPLDNGNKYYCTC